MRWENSRRVAFGGKIRDTVPLRYGWKFRWWPAEFMVRLVGLAARSYDIVTYLEYLLVFGSETQNSLFLTGVILLSSLYPAKWYKPNND